METRKLYYEDCMLRGFSAVVTGCEEVKGGWAVTLDATAFYPEGGGQACDTGTLGKVRVLDVREKDEAIIHLCDGPLTVGEAVEGQIDWQRRFDLMQQHTGEHIVSGIVHSLFGWHNVGFHVGAEGMEVDFDGPIPADMVAKIEAMANEAVWADQPVRCWYPSPEELPTVGYRTKKDLPWPVRVVQVGDVDKCACCGVHTATTGQVGIIKIFSCVKFHQGVRMVMSCGRRALEQLNRIYEQNRLVSQAFSAKPMETGAAAQRMNELLAQEKFRSAELEKRLFTLTAKAYSGKGNVLRFEEGLSAAGVRELAEAISACCGGIAAVLSGEDGAYDVCLACPGGDVKTVGTAMAKALDGRGGGKPGFFQGRVRSSRAEIEAFFLEQGFSNTTSK